ncbi:LacI family transcriptional regulator [Actinoalloteichus sp. AHMU CJ021]|uniref:Transcriptional regulator, LacI family n=1 Tax=Actinoalloteichus caeruleus DSM 43889 TaxID=1120930 RepID=A0ABT1JNK3_ACTCY|nr:LacI family DNA-binding transcriptional regulator [Actinoalloteichus caeruleus]AUS79623.1 LacI family transcriptional regulator [Actinoalloteichus sp. AHMU CJ021]MCP2333844.1 transcriptional regulator, LacI family [Actinoalloteichus caeruleus DSM 43889]
MARRQPTLVEVAQHARVSLATASRVLNGSNRRVGEELRNRVVVAATELGYLVNASAQALARSASPVVGLLVHDIADPYFSSIAAGVSRVAEDRGLVVVLGVTGREAHRELSLLSTLRAHRARAVVLAGSRTTESLHTERLSTEMVAFMEQGGRVACISQDRLPVHTVVPANKDGARALASRLAELGHRRFGVLAGPADLVSAVDRTTGFLEGLANRDDPLPEPVLVHGAFTRDGGYQSTREMLARDSGITCLFAVNDVMATGAMAAIRDQGLRVPSDLSVAGFDDIPTLRDLVPSLSTVRLPLEQMGEQAARLAFGDQPIRGTRTVRTRAEVVLRQSTAPPPR